MREAISRIGLVRVDVYVSWPFGCMSVCSYHPSTFFLLLDTKYFLSFPSYIDLLIQCYRLYFTLTDKEKLSVTRIFLHYFKANSFLITEWGFF